MYVLCIHVPLCLVSFRSAIDAGRDGHTGSNSRQQQHSQNNNDWNEDA